MKYIKIIYYKLLEHKYWKIQLEEYLKGYSNTKNYYRWEYYKLKVMELSDLENKFI